MKKPPGVQIIRFADDVTVVGIARTGDATANPVLNSVSQWMENNGLKLALHKSEEIVLTNKHRFQNP